MPGNGNTQIETNSHECRQDNDKAELTLAVLEQFLDGVKVKVDDIEISHDIEPVEWTAANWTATSRDISLLWARQPQNGVARWRCAPG